MAIWTLTYKDLIILARDRRALAMLLLMPMAFIAIIGMSTGQLFAARNQGAVLRLVLVDSAHDELVEKIAEGLQERAGVSLVRTERTDEAQASVDDGDEGVAVIVGPSFRQRIDALELGDLLDPNNGRLAQGPASIDIDLYARPTDLMARAIAEQLVFGAALRAILPEVAGRYPIVGKFMEHATSSAEPPAAAPAPDDSTVGGAATNRDAGKLVYQFVVPGYTVLFTFFIINIMARSFITERDQGTLLRMLISPNGSAALLAGKALPYFLVSMIQGVVLFVFGKLLFGMSWGTQPWMLLPLIAGTSLAATGLGLLTAVWVRSDSQVSAYGNLVVIVFAGISGCFMPRAWLPEFMRTISLATPHAWALIGYDQALVSARPSMERIVSCCIMLFVFGALFFVIGSIRFQRWVDR